MNKKILTVFCSFALVAFMFTGCIDNVESDGVKAIREAQAKKTLAEAADKQADADLKVAQLKYKVALDSIAVEAKKIDLETSRLAAEIAAAGHDNKVAAEIAKQEAALIAQKALLEKAKYDVEIAILTAQMNYAKAKTTNNEALKAEYENVAAKIDALIGSANTTSAKRDAEYATLQGIMNNIYTKTKAIADKEKDLATEQGKATPDAQTISTLQNEIAKLKGELEGLNNQKKASEDKIAIYAAEILDFYKMVEIYKAELAAILAQIKA